VRGDLANVLDAKTFFAARAAIRHTKQFQTARRKTGAVANQLHGLINDGTTNILNQFNTVVDRTDRTDEVMTNF